MNQKPFQGVQTYTTKEYTIEKKKSAALFTEIDDMLNTLQLKDGMAVSFHHHLRNGDEVLPMVMAALQKRGIKNITLAASSVFPCHAMLVDLLEDGTVTRIHADYISGPVAEAISRGKCKEVCTITTHGGRPRAILEGELPIDVAFLAAPSADKKGNATGSMGPSSCGVLGYAIADAQMAKEVVLITDHLVDSVDEPEIDGHWVDAVLTVDRIGDKNGIVSGTTRVTRDPVGLRVARHTVDALAMSGILDDGFSFQTGAGGISLAVATYLRDWMIEHNVKGSFASGGITDALVQMMEEGLFENLWDVQCFTVGATESIAKNANHKKMSASKYANPLQMGNIVDQLDVVILGASEIDLDFNVNVTTGSDGMILGGSGGHADTAAGAKIAVIVTKLVNARRAAVVKKVRTISTPGETVDLIVTERGLAVNPKNQWLTEKLKHHPMYCTIEQLYDTAIQMTGIPKERPKGEKVVAVSEYRDGTMLDQIYEVEE